MNLGVWLIKLFIKVSDGLPCNSTQEKCYRKIPEIDKDLRVERKND